MGEGAGALVLEEYEHAKARGAKIYAEVDRLRPVGRRLSHHRPVRRRRRRLPGPVGGREGRGPAAPSDIDYVNAHGTSTMADGIEAGAVERFLGDHAKNVVDVVDQVDDRPPAGRGRRDRGDLLDPGDPRPDRPADHQPGQSGRARRHRTWRRTRPCRTRSTWRCPTASASAAPTPPSCSAKSREQASPRPNAAPSPGSEDEGSPQGQSAPAQIRAGRTPHRRHGRGPADHAGPGRLVVVLAAMWVYQGPGPAAALGRGHQRRPASRRQPARDRLDPGTGGGDPLVLALF